MVQPISRIARINPSPNPGRGFESHPSNMPVMFFHRTRESTEYTVLTHIGVWVKNKINRINPISS